MFSLTERLKGKLTETLRVKSKLIRSLVEFDTAVARRLKRASLGPNFTLHKPVCQVLFCISYFPIRYSQMDLIIKNRSSRVLNL